MEDIEQMSVDSISAAIDQLVIWPDIPLNDLLRDLSGSEKFRINCYLDEIYEFTQYPTEGTSCLAAILSALIKKDPEVLSLCVWALASFKKTLRGRADGKTCSFLQELRSDSRAGGAKSVEAKAYPTDPAMEEWVAATSSEPGFEIFSLALAMFLIGFPKRKAFSQSNHLRDGKWKSILASISSFTRPLPRKIKINFLKDTVLSESQRKSACGACLFLEGTVIGRKLRSATLVGIVRPICDHHTVIRRRFEEFKRLYPEAFFKESSFWELPLASRGLEQVERLEKVMAEAKAAKAELQPLMIGSINIKYLSFLRRTATRSFQSYLFYCICNRKGRRGRENWRAFMETEEKKGSKKLDPTHIKMYDRWISSLRVE